MYISLWENSRGHPDNVSFMQFSTKIDGFEQKDSQGFENSYNSYEQYPLEKFFIFTIYQNYTLALILLLLLLLLLVSDGQNGNKLWRTLHIFYTLNFLLFHCSFKEFPYLKYCRQEVSYVTYHEVRPWKEMNRKKTGK